MFVRILIQILCLTTVLIQIKAFVKPFDSRNGLSFLNSGQNAQNIQKNKLSYKPSAQLPQYHQIMDILRPIVHSLLNRQFHQERHLESTDYSNLDSVSKVEAHLKSKFLTKISESIIDRRNNVENLVVSRTFEQTGDTDAVIDLNSDIDIISDKNLEANGSDESKPLENTSKSDSARIVLNRIKRETNETNNFQDEAKKTLDKVTDTFKKVGQVVKDVFKKHVAEPVKKFAADVKQKVEDWQKNRQEQGQTEK